VLAYSISNSGRKFFIICHRNIFYNSTSYRKEKTSKPFLKRVAFKNTQTFYQKKCHALLSRNILRHGDLLFAGNMDYKSKLIGRLKGKNGIAKCHARDNSHKQERQLLKVI